MSFFISRNDDYNYKNIGHEFCINYYNDVEYNGYNSTAKYYYSDAKISFLGREFNDFSSFINELNRLNIKSMSINNISGINQPELNKKILINTTGNFCIKDNNNSIYQLTGSNIFSNTFVLVFNDNTQQWHITNHIFKQI